MWWLLPASTTSLAGDSKRGPHRPVQFGSTTWFGTFFDGHLTQWQDYVKWTSAKGKVQLDFEFENNFGHLPQGNFVQRLWSVQGAYAWNPNLVLSSFIQYDTDHKISAQTLGFAGL